MFLGWMKRIVLVFIGWDEEGKMVVFIDWVEREIQVFIDWMARGRRIGWLSRFFPIPRLVWIG